MNGQPEDAPATAHLVRFRTAHGTILAARTSDGRVVHVAPTLIGAGYDPLVGLFLPISPDLCFLAAGGEETIMMTADGELTPATVLAYQATGSDGTSEDEASATGASEGGGSAQVNLRSPATGKYVCAPWPADNAPTAITVDRPAAGGWETFTTEPAHGRTPPPLERVEALLADGATLTDGTLLLSLARSADPTDLSVAALLIGLQPAETLRGLVPELSALPSYAMLFAHLQLRLAGEETVFAFNTALAMREQAQAYGWQIGAHSYGTPEVIDGMYGHLAIGKICSIAGQVQIILANHAMDRVTTYPFHALQRFWPNAAAAAEDHTGHRVVIGHAVWIGAGACILPGTQVGHGAVIGARAVARGAIPPFSIVVGNPGRVVRRLFDDATVERLLAVAWWNWPDDKIDRYIPLLLNPDVHAFLAAAERDIGGPDALEFSGASG